MSVVELLKRLQMEDVRVRADGDRLRVSAPRGALTPELQDELVARKPEILSFLQAPSANRSSLVPIQPSGSRPAFYGVPGAEGDVFCYLPLARRLGPDQPFYAFEPPGFDGVEPPPTSIEALAARYLADLRAFQPAGPYFIGGFCVGGIVAFELARQLEAEGQEVALLALFETPSPKGLRPWARAVSTVRYRSVLAAARFRWLANQSWRHRLGYLRSRLSRLVYFPMLIGRAPDQPKSPVFRATFKAIHTYVRKPRPYAGRIVLFLGSPALRRQGYWRQLDWAQVAAGGLEVKVGIEGCIDHAMMLRDPPHLHALAGLLRPYLEHPRHR